MLLLAESLTAVLPIATDVTVEWFVHLFVCLLHSC